MEHKNKDKIIELTTKPEKLPFKDPRYSSVESKNKEFIKLNSDQVRKRLQTPKPVVKDNNLPQYPGGNKCFGKTPT